MNDEWRDKIIAEVWGLEWHEYKIGNPKKLSTCSCGNQGCAVTDYCIQANPDFSTWEGFGIIMDMESEREWWWKFLHHLLSKWYQSTSYTTTINEFWFLGFINPTVIRNELSSWLKDHEGEWRKE